MPERFAESVTRLVTRARRLGEAHRSSGRPLSTFGLERLPLYVSEERLDSTLVVLCDQLPLPSKRELAPFNAETLTEGPYAVATYGKLIFVLKKEAHREEVFFRGLVFECLIDVVGIRDYIFSYLFGYAFEGADQSPIVETAVRLVDRFQRDPNPFDLEAEVRKVYPSIVEVIKGQHRILESLMKDFDNSPALD